MIVDAAFATPLSDTRQSTPPSRSLGLQLYAASNILGVGVFTLPFLIPMVGLLPALLMPCLVGMVVAPLYRRIVVAAHRSANNPGGSPKPSGSRVTLASPVVQEGGGAAASYLGRLGAALRAIPTMLAYLAIGAAAMHVIDETLQSTGSARLILCAWLAATGAARLVERQSAAAAAVLRLGRFWAAGLLLADFAELTGIFRTSALVLGVMAGIVGLGSARQSSSSGTRSFEGLRREHASAVAVMVVQLVVMAGIAIVAIAVLATGSGFESPALLVPPSPRSLVVSIGVALFALTGTGHVNTASYRVMRTPAGAARVVGGSVRIAVGVQLAWLVATSLTVPTATLARLDYQKSFSTVGMANALASNHATIGQIVFVLGAVLVLFALSGSTHIVSESLAIEFTASHPGRCRQAQVASIATASAVAVVLLSSGVSATGLLAVSGLGGGLLIIFVMPLLAESDPSRHYSRRNQAIAISVACFVLSGASQLFDGSIDLALAAIMLGMTVVTLIAQASRNMRRSRPTGHREEVLAVRAKIAYSSGQSGDLDRAIYLFAELLPDAHDALGPTHKDVLSIRANIAYWTGQRGDVRPALRLFTELLPDAHAALGPMHKDVLAIRANIAYWTGRNGSPYHALHLFTELLPDAHLALGPKHKDVLAIRASIAYWTPEMGALTDFNATLDSGFAELTNA